MFFFSSSLPLLFSGSKYVSHVLFIVAFYHKCGGHRLLHPLPPSVVSDVVSVPWRPHFFHRPISFWPDIAYYLSKVFCPKYAPKKSVELCTERGLKRRSGPDFLAPRLYGPIKKFTSVVLAQINRANTTLYNPYGRNWPDCRGQKVWARPSLNQNVGRRNIELKCVTWHSVDSLRSIT